LSPLRHKKEKPLRQQRDELHLRFLPRDGAPVRAVFHSTPPPQISPRQVRLPFSESSNGTPYRVPKPWYESDAEMDNAESMNSRRLYCDARVCTKLQAQKDFMRPGW
jgi:hypothetical protein